ncbi:alpha-xylosidase [Actinophytocola oryzae]|uniref:alpha-D-xyloside xylohydrolase n=1 Tax=Actinophytocola oryzae TaxID=502181 RepID=A0A4V3FUI0_9PSEU|nr:alpha-xylosidase [Actinophytocola oryzae]TDV55331.1 alpha-D-xyloside xylohydrolase [Actinophytocola oryzae]
MKFTDGHWMMREGVTPTYAVQVLDVAATAEGMRILAPTYPVRNRRDLQSGAVLTLDVTAPMPDVIGVRIAHHAGGSRKSPQFELFPSGGTPETDVDDETAVLASGALSVRVRRAEPWLVEFVANGRTLTFAGAKDTALMSTSDGGRHVVQRLGLGVGDAVYGMGERFGPLVKNGQAVDIWNADGGTCTEQAYKNVPFFLTNAGYGVFVNYPGSVSFEVGSEDVSKLQFSVESQSMQYFVIYGPTPKEILSKYTALTGRPALPPAWSFGLWLSTSFNTDYDEQTVTSFIEGMAERDLPLSVFHFDCFWMRELSWCDFEWDPRVFPDPRGMLARLKSRGLRVCVWINPYVAQRSALFEEGRARGYFLKRPNGDVWQWDLWQPGLAIVDFTNPEACEWFAAKLDALLDMGVDCFKSDFGERIPTDVVYYDGSDPTEMHNYYTYLYNRTVFDLLRKRRGERDAVVFARSATVGTQQFPVHWGGDNLSTPQSMAESLRGGLSLTMSGFGFWSHDIGGFEGTPEAWLFKRWIAFGLLSSHSRLHANYSYRVPWAFDEEAVDVLRLFTKLKATLMPYLYQAARVAHLEGVPVMRAMVVEFPDDPACVHLDRQYLLGTDLLVAPVFTEDGRVEYYVPDGEWTQLLSGETVTGPRWVREEHGFASVPLLVRPGAVLPVGAVDDRPEYDYADGVTLRVFGDLAEGATVTTEIPTVAGDVACVFTTTRRGGSVHVTVDNPPANWRVQLGSSTPVSASGSSITVDVEHQ